MSRVFIAALACMLVAQGKSITKTSDVVRMTASAEPAGDDGKQTIILTLTIDPPYHIYANPVENEYLTGAQTLIRVNPATQLRDVKVSYPAGKEVTLFADYRMRIYEGTVKASITLVRKKDSGPLEVSAAVRAADNQRSLLPSLLKVNVP